MMFHNLLFFVFVLLGTVCVSVCIVVFIMALWGKMQFGRIAGL